MIYRNVTRRCPHGFDREQRLCPECVPIDSPRAAPVRNKRKLAARKADIIARVEAGEKLSDIAEVHGRTIRTIQDVLRRSGMSAAGLERREE